MDYYHYDDLHASANAIGFRWLDETNETAASTSTSTSTTSTNSTTTTTTTNSTTTTTVIPTYNDAETLRTTMRVYGGLFCIMFLIFCIVRRRYPKVYNVRNWVEDLQTELASDQRGFIRWMWQLFLLPEKVLLDECGMDALCYTRILEFGLKLSAIGMLNAIWLIPVYATARSDDITKHIEDPIVTISVAHVPSGSNRFIALVLAAYVIFGFAMYNILKEFEWFIRYRHYFLSKQQPRNYAVYVQNIPEEYRTNQRLLEFFQGACSNGANDIVDVNVLIKVPVLKKKIAERQAVVTNLEHAINIEEIKGVTPTRRSVLGEQIKVIDDLFSQLTNLNADITTRIEGMENEIRKRDRWGFASPQITPMPSHDVEELGIVPTEISKTANFNADDDFSAIEETSSSGVNVTYTTNGTNGSSNNNNGTNNNNTDNNKYTDNNDNLDSMTLEQIQEQVQQQQGPPSPEQVKAMERFTKNIPTDAIFNLANNAGGMAMSLLTKEDGAPESSAFITFGSLRSANAALQMIQYPEPFAMEVLEAPEPQDIFWSNVGKNHHELQVGKLLSFGLTTALCLFWTVPMAFISTLSSIEGLVEQFAFIGDLVQKYPWIEPVLVQLAPLMIILLNALLPMILTYLSSLEGPISGAVVQASLFSKLTAFMIIQTFFVNTISGTIVSELSKMLEDTSLIIDLLATSLPGQSTLFIQLLMVDTFLSMGLELLRVVPIAIATIRSFLGPNLTEKERSQPWMGLSPLNDPGEFGHANLLAGTVLYFMVYFVYATMAPISCFFMGICFLLMGAGYRHQFIYIYQTFPDSGGRLWVAFFKILPTCMIIAQVTLVGLLALNKSPIASAMMFPLLIITILFSYYINQKHFQMAEHLPSRECIATDLKNNAEAPMSVDFLKRQYMQPEFTEKELLPENMSVEREMAQGVVYGTPENSVSGGDNGMEGPLGV